MFPFYAVLMRRAAIDVVEMDDLLDEADEADEADETDEADEVDGAGWHLHASHVTLTDRCIDSVASLIRIDPIQQPQKSTIPARFHHLLDDDE